MARADRSIISGPATALSLSPGSGLFRFRRRLAAASVVVGLRRVLGVGLFFVVWELGSLAANNRLFPDVGTVFSTLGQDLRSGTILANAQITFQHAFVALGIAIVIAIPLGLAMARSKILGAMFEPLMSATYPVPKIAMYPLLILAFGLGGASTIVLVAASCVYPIAANTLAGVSAIKKQYFWVAHNVEAGRLATAKMVIRAASPSVLASLRVAVPTMLVVTVIAELLAGSVGLGFQIRNAGTEFDPADQMAAIFFLAVCGFVLDRILVYASRIVVFWERSAEL